jgi:DNA-directed RNA polymerase subunit RPC12/RpoP
MRPVRTQTDTRRQAVYEFCPHCSQALEQEQVAGRMLVCARCGKDIGFVGAVQRAAVAETEELIRGGTVGRCPVCAQAVELKMTGESRTFVPHYGASPPRKLCPGSGKPVAADLPPPPAAKKKTPPGNNLRAFMTRDVIKVVFWSKGADPRIEMLTLEYLEKTERVRIQIEALREMLGQYFRMRDYPASLNKPDLALWISAADCVVAKKRDHGGYDSIADAEVTAVLADIRQCADLFFT